jgi:hypothetical protein
MFNTGVSKFELALMIPGLRKRLKIALKDGTLDVARGLDVATWLLWKFHKASNKQYEELFLTLSCAFNSTANLIDHKEEKMKFELGITVGEITAMLPAILSEAWMHYSDDKRISVDEGILLVATILEQMADAADDDMVVDFFEAQAAALAALAPFFVEEAGEEDENDDDGGEEEPPTDPPV